MYSELVTTISDSEFDELFEASYDYLAENCDDFEGWPKAEIKEDFKRLTYADFSPVNHCLVLRDDVSNNIMGLHQGVLTSDGTLESESVMFGLDRYGSRSWAYQLGDNELAMALFNPLGIQRIYFYPVGANMVAYMKAIHCTLDGTKEGDKNRPRYRSAWGW